MFQYDEKMNKIPVENYQPKPGQKIERFGAGASPSSSSKKKVPKWVWITLAVLVALILIVVIAMVFKSKKGATMGMCGSGMKSKFGFRFY